MYFCYNTSFILPKTISKIWIRLIRWIQIFGIVLEGKKSVLYPSKYGNSGVYMGISCFDYFVHVCLKLLNSLS